MTNLAKQVSTTCVFCYHFYRPETKFVKVMFLHVSFCPQDGGHVWQGGVHAGGHAWQGGVCGTPPSRYYDIWSISGRYASCWNAFLWFMVIIIVFVRSCYVIPTLSNLNLCSTNPFVEIFVQGGPDVAPTVKINE